MPIIPAPRECDRRESVTRTRSLANTGDGDDAGGCLPSRHHHTKPPNVVVMGKCVSLLHGIDGRDTVTTTLLHTF